MQAGIDQFSASPRMNQYEKGKHLPDLLMMEHLAAATGVPLPYFFAQEDELAEVLVLWGKLGEEERTALLAAARSLVKL
jgi:transcriptional regulator with XRE-family HTH domain